MKTPIKKLFPLLLSLFLIFSTHITAFAEGSGNLDGRCGDFLFIPGHDCIPILLPCSDAETFLGTQIDCTDCAGILSSKTFFRLYHKWLELVTDSDQICPLQQILPLLNQEKIAKIW